MKTRLWVLVWLMLASIPAWADGRSAIKSLYNNFAASKLEPGVKESELIAQPTLVRGMVALSTTQGKFMGFTNEAGTLFGDFKGFQGLPRGAAAFRSLTREETADLRREITANIDTGKLITVRYGAGKMKLFLFTAIDCAACKELEDRLRGATKTENSTFYIIPSSIHETSNKTGIRQWRKVAALWCAPDPAHAWKTYWSHNVVPPTRTCQFADPGVAEHTRKQLVEIMTAVGVPLKAVPMYVRMDGTLYNRSTHNKPLERSKPAYWLPGIGRRAEESQNSVARP